MSRATRARAPVGGGSPYEIANRLEQLAMLTRMTFANRDSHSCRVEDVRSSEASAVSVGIVAR
jgi:hypothetical protein